jgi:hypothetical protein
MTHVREIEVHTVLLPTFWSKMRGILLEFTSYKSPFFKMAAESKIVDNFLVYLSHSIFSRFHDINAFCLLDHEISNPDFGNFEIQLVQFIENL